MVDEDLGRATVVYEHPEEGTVETTVENEHVVYFRDHWTIKSGEDEAGNDVVRRIPHHRVHYVERSVEEFEQEIDTIQNRIQSVADDLKTKLLGEESDRDVHRIDVEGGRDGDDG